MRRIAKPVLLEAVELTKSFKLGLHTYLHAVDSVSLMIRKGETVALIGESGCGKSTLGRLLLGFERPDRGHVLFEGVPLSKLSARRARDARARIQMVFQDSASAFHPRRSIGRSLQEPLRIHGRPCSKEVIEGLLTRVGLAPEMYDRLPGALSGGQRQRLNIARALSLAPSLIVADEPVSALDVSVQAQIVNLFSDLKSELGLACLFITHNLPVARQIADRLLVMYLGKVVEEGETVDILARPAHPYTRALIDAIPLPGKTMGPLLQGDVPSPLSRPTGCVFHQRCPLCQPRCKTEAPLWEKKGLGRRVACHYPLI